MAVYANGLSGPFIFDDHSAIVGSDRLPNTPTAGRPLVALSFEWNRAVGGLDARGYHAVNIAIHACAALLLYGLARRTFLAPAMKERYGPAASTLALASALFWAVHPLNSEAVDYLTQRTESLMALMFALTLYASSRALAVRARTNWQLTAVAAAALGMACKESMVGVPLVVVLYDRVFIFDNFRLAMRNRWRLYAGLFLTWIVLGVLVASGPRSGSAGFSSGVASSTYALNQAVMLVRYLRLVVWPTDLVISYGHPVALTLAQVWPKVLLLAFLLVATVVAASRRSPLGFVGAWMVITLAPTSSIIPIATEVGAERRMYLPLMAPAVAWSAMLLGSSGTAVGRRSAAGPSKYLSWSAGGFRLVAVLTIAIFAALTFVRNGEYASALTLAQTTLARWPTPVAHGMVGSELAALGRDEEALPELRIASVHDPAALYNLGITLFNRGEHQQAIRELTKFAVQYPLRQEVPLARRVMGSAYAAQRKWPEAIAEYRLAHSMAPTDLVTRQLLIDTFVNQGAMAATQARFAEAVTAFRAALELSPGDVDASHYLARALYDSGDVAGALAEARQTLTRDPNHAASYDLIARSLTIQGRFDEALDALKSALRLSPDDNDFQDDLRTVLAARARAQDRPKESDR